MSGPGMRRRQGVTVVLALASLAVLQDAGCRPRVVPIATKAVQACREGKYEGALAILEPGAGASGEDPGARDLRIALLARLGRIPEAMDAYSARTGGGAPHDPLLLEALLLGAFPEGMRVDPVAVAGGGRRPEPGSATESALAVAVRAPAAAPGADAFPWPRLAWLLGVLAIPGRDASLGALEPLVTQKRAPLLRGAALDAHAQICTRAAVERLGRYAERFSTSTIMQRQILDVIARFPASGAAQAAALLGSKDQSVRARAAGVLVRTGDADADGLLRASDTIEAKAALLARNPSEPGAGDALLEHLKSLGTPLEISRFLVLVDETGGEGMLPLLCEAAHSADPGVATTAIQIMSNDPAPLSGACLVDVAMAAKPGILEAAAIALVSVPATGREADLAKLVDGLWQQGNSQLAAVGAGALGRTGGADAERILLEMLRSGETRTRRAASVALLHLGHEEVLPTVLEVFDETQGPWDLLSHVEWRLLAGDPGTHGDLVARAVREGNPNLRDKVLEVLVARLDPVAIPLVEEVQLGRLEGVPLEARVPGDDRVASLARLIVDDMSLRGDGQGRRGVIEDLLGSDDPYLVLVGLHLIEPGDRGWAMARAEEVLAGNGDPWLRLEAVRALAILTAS